MRPCCLCRGSCRRSRAPTRGIRSRGLPYGNSPSPRPPIPADGNAVRSRISACFVPPRFISSMNVLLFGLPRARLRSRSRQRAASFTLPHHAGPLRLFCHLSYVPSWLFISPCIIDERSCGKPLFPKAAMTRKAIGNIFRGVEIRNYDCSIKLDIACAPRATHCCRSARECSYMR